MSKDNKTLIQAWLSLDNPRHQYGVEIWEHYKEQNGGLTADTMAESLIAYNEKIAGGFQPVPDESPAIVKQLKDSIKKIEGIAKRLSSLDFNSISFANDLEEVKQEVNDAMVEFNITSDSMRFEEEDDDDF